MLSSKDKISFFREALNDLISVEVFLEIPIQKKFLKNHFFFTFRKGKILRSFNSSFFGLAYCHTVGISSLNVFI